MVFVFNPPKGRITPPDSAAFLQLASLSLPQPLEGRKGLEMNTEVLT